MSSGRDVYLERISEEIKQREKELCQSQKEQHQNRMITRMIDYRQTLITEIARLDKIIKELQDDTV